MRDTNGDELTLTLLSSTLQLAVPLWIERLRGRNWEYIQERAHTCCDVISGPDGAYILYRSKKKGDTANAFNHLAEGIACLSFAPGGVKIFGSHWESCLNTDVPDRSRNTLLRLMEAMKLVLQPDNPVQSSGVPDEEPSEEYNA